jgi:hypothetical protein
MPALVSALGNQTWSFINPKTGHDHATAPGGISKNCPAVRDLIFA